MLTAALTAIALPQLGGDTLPAIVARVNGAAITRAQVEARLAQSRAMSPERYDSMTAAERRRAMQRTLNSLVIREVQVQEAKKHGLTVADEELQKDVRDLEATAGARGGLERLLAAYGTTLGQWKEEARRNLLIQKLEDAEAARLPLTEEDIRDESTRLSLKDERSAGGAAVDGHRERLITLIRQRRWSAQRPEWLRALVERATIWRWTPDAGITPP